MFLLVVVNRSSLGVSGPYAEARFGIGPSQLSLFVMLQVGIYAALQMPAGALVDRYGPRRTLITAGVLVASAQLLFGISHEYPTAIVARIVLGCGDALTFVSVLRVAMSTADRQRYPAWVALTQLVGLAGNLLATLPLLFLLRTTGWEPTYIGLAIATGTLAVAIHLGLRDGWQLATPGQSLATQLAGLARGAKQAWGLPDTRLGYWMHFSCLTAAMTFLLLWGYPYLHRGAGMSEAAAGSVMFAGVLLSGALMPVSGWLFSKRPAARIPIAVGVAGSTAVGWGLILALAGDSPPHILVAILFTVSMVGVPACGAAFAIVRDRVDPAVVSTATGIVNVGGYLATVLAATGVGLVLQLSHEADATAFRWALAVMVLVQAVGVFRVIVWQRRAGSPAAETTQTSVRAAGC